MVWLQPDHRKKWRNSVRSFPSPSYGRPSVRPSIQLEIWVPDMGTWPLHCWLFGMVIHDDQQHGVTWDFGLPYVQFLFRDIQIGDGSFPFGTIGYSGMKTRVLGSWPMPKWKKQELLSATYPSVLISLVVPKHPLRKVVFLSYCLAILGFVWNKRWCFSLINHGHCAKIVLYPKML